MVAAYPLEAPVQRRAGFHVITDGDRPTYDTESQVKPQGFTKIPDVVRAMNDGFALAVFEAIARNDNGSHESWPSVKTICERTGWSRKVVEPAINRLIAAGALVKEARKLNGMDQSNRYRITAWNQVVPTELPVVPGAPAVVPTEPLGSSHGTIGTFPQNYEQEPIDQEPLEQDPPQPPEIGGSSRRPTKPLPEHGPAQQIVKAYCLVARLEQPANYRKAVGQAAALVKAGVTPEQIPDLYEFVAGWAKSADLGLLLAQVDRWRSSKSRVVTSNGTVTGLPPGFELPPGLTFREFEDWIAYRKAGLSMPEERNVLVDRYLAATNGRVLA